MTYAVADRHVYLRSIAQGERTSLSVMAGMVAPGARVLDLGTGSGALGQYLGEHSGCIVDGVTINEDEAALARPHYRRIEVANLDQPDWASMFSGESYDCVVCGDVLEHLRQPEATLLACSQLLAPGGRLLISVPNASYSGLVAELMQGDFKYREEGLLDRTHLRFFTRRSLAELLAAEGWSVDAIETIQRPLSESEFKVSFDRLPPAVARYLLGQPDAGAYQLIAAARPVSGEARATTKHTFGEPAAALFTAELYLGNATGMPEKDKLRATGVVGVERQVMRFTLPPGLPGITRLRLDPADRPGFLHLHRISLLAGRDTAWQWRADTDGLAMLEGAPHQQMMMRAPWSSALALALLHGDDPQIELPVPQAALETCGGAAQAVLEVELGWPMSADYMTLVEAVTPLLEQVDALRMDADRVWRETDRLRQQSRQEAEQAEQQATQARQQADVARKQADNARLQAEQALRTLQDAEARHREAQIRQREATVNASRELAAKDAALMEQNQNFLAEKQQLTRHRLALQAQLKNSVNDYQALAEHLRWIEQSTVFRMTRPLVHAKIGVERLLGKRPPALPAVPGSALLTRPIAPRVGTVDVIVPVYRGLADTQLCIRSVLASSCQTPWRLIVINDASPEPDVTAWLREASAQDNRILLLENDENLGFVATVNRGMAWSGSHDVLLLNSDTEVANDWLDRLRRAAYSDARVASVTPFSNNATICSYPLFCEGNALPPGIDTAGLDTLFAGLHAGRVVDVPTGVGFCMYIRRDCLDEVGLFDVREFGKGYGEENDFCRRAAAAGWRNLHALDTFVLHTGGVSFGASKSAREIEAVEKLRRLHPSYDGLVHSFVAADPARTARLAVDLARVRASGRPCVLAVLHNRGGGTQRHALELAGHLHDRAAFFSLTPAPGGTVALELLEPGAGFRLEFAVATQWPALLQALRAIGIAHVHYHHVSGHSHEVFGLGEELGVPWDFTAHDFYTMCPQISLTDQADRYCGEEGGGECRRCQPQTPALGGGDIAGWRERHGRLLTTARHVLAPSRDTGRRFLRMWPAADVRLAPHTDIPSAAELPAPQVRPLAPGAPLRVVVIGGLSRIKGADLLEDVATLAARHGAQIEFHLIGHAYHELRKQPRAALTVHGPYAEADLPRLLAWLKPDLAWFPALWPETYSYTLSACLLAGLPVIAPNIGAFPERLSGRQWSWVRPWDSTPVQWLEFFGEVWEQHFATGRPPKPYWALAAANDDARLGSWSYATDYLNGVESAATSEPLDAAFLAAHGTSRGEGMHRQQLRLKAIALTALVRLRSAPPLRRFARAIPPRWQTRVKTWLRA